MDRRHYTHSQGNLSVNSRHSSITGLSKRAPSISSLTNSQNGGEILTEELQEISSYQREQRRKDASIADLEQLRFHKIMALCDEISHTNFDSGTGSMQNTPFKTGIDSGFGNSHPETNNSNNMSKTTSTTVTTSTSNTLQNLPELSKPPRNKLRSLQPSSPLGQQQNIQNSENNNANSPSSPINYNFQSTLNLKQTIQLIESQLDEAQRQAEIEKTLIHAELKSENQTLESDLAELKRIDNELVNLNPCPPCTLEKLTA